LLIGVELESQLARDLLLRRRASELSLELVGDLLDQARLLPHAARYPVERSEVVEDRTADAELRVGREHRLFSGLVFPEGVEQPDDAPRDQIVEIDVRRLACRQPLHHTPNQRQVLSQDLLAVAGERRVAAGHGRPAAAPRPELSIPGLRHGPPSPRSPTAGRRTGARRSLPPASGRAAAAPAG